MVHHTPITDSGDLLHMITPSRTRKLSRSDVHFPLSTPRRHRAPSITETLLEGQGNNTLTRQKLSVRVRATACWEDEAEHETVPKVSGKDVVDDELGNDKMAFRRSHGKTLEDLPLEIQGLILDYLFGDLHSVTSTSTSLHPAVKRISSAMRHPRRKALTDVALVSPAWRELVQERIYRHSKGCLQRLPSIEANISRSSKDQGEPCWSDRICGLVFRELSVNKACSSHRVLGACVGRQIF